MLGFLLVSCECWGSRREVVLLIDLIGIPRAQECSKGFRIFGFVVVCYLFRALSMLQHKRWPIFFSFL